MFRGSKFIELKGSALSYNFKIQLCDYLIKYCTNLFKINIIQLNYEFINEKTYQDKARAFNYFLDLFLINRLKNNSLPKDDYIIQIDERNTKTSAKNSLEDYLAIDLSIKHDLINSISVSYQDSSKNKLIQLSDFFSNLYYSFLMNPSSYNETIKKLETSKILNKTFIFPKRPKK